MFPLPSRKLGSKLGFGVFSPLQVDYLNLVPTSIEDPKAFGTILDRALVPTLEKLDLEHPVEKTATHACASLTVLGSSHCRRRFRLLFSHNGSSVLIALHAMESRRPVPSVQSFIQGHSARLILVKCL